MLPYFIRQHPCPLHIFINPETVSMRIMPVKKYFRKYGRKALIIYLCWCVLKGLIFLFIGSKLFG